MTLDELVHTLRTNGLVPGEPARLGNDKGHQVRTQSGAIVCLYDTGKIVLQGKNTDEVRKVLGEPAEVPHAGGAKVDKVAQPSRKVFVVYGHDPKARDALEAMLRRWGLEPLILDQLPSEGQTIIEKLERVRAEANYAVVLATPDDEGHRKDKDDEKALRARQNVVLELGMMLAVLGRPRVAILVQSSDKMERPSDIQGLIYIPFNDSVEDAKLNLAKEINSQGIAIDLKRL